MRYWQLLSVEWIKITRRQLDMLVKQRPSSITKLMTYKDYRLLSTAGLAPSHSHFSMSIVTLSKVLRQQKFKQSVDNFSPRATKVPSAARRTKKKSRRTSKRNGVKSWSPSARTSPHPFSGVKKSSPKVGTQLSNAKSTTPVAQCLRLFGTIYKFRSLKPNTWLLLRRAISMSLDARGKRLRPSARRSNSKKRLVHDTPCPSAVKSKIMLIQISQ